MGFLDNIKDRLRLEPQDDGYYDDDFYDADDGYADAGYEPQRHEATGGGLLGNTSRPEADSVSVYTRSGRPLGGNSGGPQPYDDGRRDSQRRAPVATNAYGSDSYRHGSADVDSHAPSHASSEHVLTAVPRSSSSKLPPYVLKPQSYDDVQTVVRRVRTNQPVVLSFHNTNIDAAKRIFDFCAGLSCGVGGSIDELGDRCFVVLPAGRTLSQADIDKLVADGTIVR